ncbi:aldehyde dehydrogenase family protein [Streptomyces antimycoticus]|uniref:aldehyde dehydrogenase family protein n=1 Tax=Streptomyces antimycoticus TaxID=68175 RepID=UPI003873569F
MAKTPTDGGPACLTLACALAAREGIPVTLVSGSGGELSETLVRSPEIGRVSFVGGRDTGARVATAVADSPTSGRGHRPRRRPPPPR